MDTSLSKAQLIQLVFKRVFGNKKYLFLAIFLFITGASIVLVLPNWSLLVDVLLSPYLDWSSKFLFWLSLYGSIVTNFTLVNALTIIVLLILFSIDLTLFIFYFRRARKGVKGIRRSRSGSFIGTISGLLGIGCVACGSVILTGLATSVGATGLLSWLPLGGGEFALIGIILLSLSISYLVKKISDPLTCKVVN